MEKSKKQLLRIGIENILLRTLTELKYAGIFLSNESKIPNPNESQEYINARDAIKAYKKYLLEEIGKR